jgi:hypothetical protein
MRRDRWETIKQRIENLPTPNPPVEKPRPHWRDGPSTKRAALAHRRRSQGIRCFSVALTEEHLDGLIFQGKLLAVQRDNRPIVQQALDAFLRECLVERFAGQLRAKSARQERANHPKSTR